MLLPFENGFKIDTLVDSGAFVNAIAGKILTILQQQTPKTRKKQSDMTNA